MKLESWYIRTGSLLLLLCSMYCSKAQKIKTLKGTTLSAKDIDSFILHQMDSLKIPALSIAIIQDGKVMYYKALGIKNEKGEKVDSTTLFEAASMTKPVFAYAVHKLVESGRIDLDTPLYRYYPYDDIDYDDRYKLITARMVLSHTTGFVNWRNGGGDELRIVSDPGTKYTYSGEGYQYLALVVRHVLIDDIQDIMAKEVFRPLSINNAFLIKNTYVLDHIADGLEDNKYWGWNIKWQRANVAFGLCTEAKEYAKFVIQLMKESHSSQSIFHRMSAPQREIEANKWVCLGLFMEQTPYGPRYSHSGNNGNKFNSNFEFYKDRDIGYVYFINCHQEPVFTKQLNAFLETGK